MYVISIVMLKNGLRTFSLFDWPLKAGWYSLGHCDLEAGSCVCHSRYTSVTKTWKLYTMNSTETLLSFVSLTHVGLQVFGCGFQSLPRPHVVPHPTHSRGTTGLWLWFPIPAALMLSLIPLTHVGLQVFGCGFQSLPPSCCPSSRSLTWDYGSLAVASNPC